MALQDSVLSRDSTPDSLYGLGDMVSSRHSAYGTEQLTQTSDQDEEKAWDNGNVDVDEFESIEEDEDDSEDEEMDSSGSEFGEDVTDDDLDENDYFSDNEDAKDVGGNQDEDFAGDGSENAEEHEEEHEREEDVPINNAYVNDDFYLPPDRSPEVLAAFNDIWRYMNLLLHTPLDRHSAVLVICPAQDKIVADTIQQMVTHNPAHIRSHVQALHFPGPTLPTFEMIEQGLKERKANFAWGLVVCFGYVTDTMDEAGLSFKAWLCSVSGLVKSYSVKPRGNLILQLSLLRGETWQSTAARYDELGTKEGIRMVSINSVQGSENNDRYNTSRRCFALARNLARIPNGHHDKSVYMLRRRGIRLMSKISFVKCVIIAPNDDLYGNFVPSSATDHVGWFSLADW